MLYRDGKGLLPARLTEYAKANSRLQFPVGDGSRRRPRRSAEAVPQRIGTRTSARLAFPGVHPNRAGRPRRPAPRPVVRAGRHPRRTPQSVAAVGRGRHSRLASAGRHHGTGTGRAAGYAAESCSSPRRSTPTGTIGRSRRVSAAYAGTALLRLRGPFARAGRAGRRTDRVVSARVSGGAEATISTPDGRTETARTREPGRGQPCCAGPIPTSAAFTASRSASTPATSVRRQRAGHQRGPATQRERPDAHQPRGFAENLSRMGSAGRDGTRPGDACAGRGRRAGTSDAAAGRLRGPLAALARCSH